jgi:hypothetical protein
MVTPEVIPANVLPEPRLSWLLWDDARIPCKLLVDFETDLKALIEVPERYSSHPYLIVSYAYLLPRDLPTDEEAAHVPF